MPERKILWRLKSATFFNELTETFMGAKPPESSNKL